MPTVQPASFFAAAAHRAPHQGRARPLPPQERRSAIVAAATPLVAQHGRRVTTRQIAEAAGIAEGTIFRVFPDKDAVIDAVVEQILDPSPAVEALAAIDLTSPLEARLTAAVEILQQRLTGVFSVLITIGRTSPPGDRDPRPPHQPANDPIMPLVEDLFVPDAERLRQDPVQSARLLRSLVFSGTHPMISDGHLLSSAQIVDLLLHGLLMADGPPGGGRPVVTQPPRPTKSSTEPRTSC